MIARVRLDHFVVSLITIVFAGWCTVSADGQEDLGIRLGTSLGFPIELPPPELRDYLKDGVFYDVFDLDFAPDGIVGRIELVAYPVRGGYLQEYKLQGSELQWTSHVIPRLFRDEVELGSEDYIVRFSPPEAVRPSLTSAPQGGPRPRVLSQVSFNLLGRGGGGLAPGIYRLWFILDMTHLPPDEDAFRGYALGKLGARPEPFSPGFDMARQGGTLFRVREVGTDPELLFEYADRRAATAHRSAIMKTPVGTHSDFMNGRHGTPVPQEELQVLQDLLTRTSSWQKRYSGDSRFIILLGVILTYMGRCDEAIPYFRTAIKTSPGWQFEGRYKNDPRVSMCAAGAAEEIWREENK